MHRLKNSSDHHTRINLLTTKNNTFHVISSKKGIIYIYIFLNLHLHPKILNLLLSHQSAHPKVPILKFAFEIFSLQGFR